MKTQAKRARYWTISNAKGRVLADGLTPPFASDREAIGWVLRGVYGMLPNLEPDAVYRMSCGDAAATAAGCELERVDASSTSTDAYCDVADHRGHLHSPPARTAPGDAISDPLWSVAEVIDEDRGKPPRGRMYVADQQQLEREALKRLTDSIRAADPPVQALGDVELRRLVTERLRAAGMSWKLGATFADDSVVVEGPVPPGTPGLVTDILSGTFSGGSWSRFVSRVRLAP